MFSVADATLEQKNATFGFLARYRKRYFLQFAIFFVETIYKGFKVKLMILNILDWPLMDMPLIKVDLYIKIKKIINEGIQLVF